MEYYSTFDSELSMDLQIVSQTHFKFHMISDDVLIGTTFDLDSDDV